MGQYLASPQRTCFLTQQPDGSLVLYAGFDPAHAGAALWSSNYRTAPGSFYTQLQEDGNLVTHSGTPDKPGGPVWASSTYGHVNAYLLVTDAGQVQIMDGTDAVWQKP